MANDLAFGGVAMTTVGSAGPDIRSDAKITVSDGARAIEISSKVGAMYGDAIRTQCESVLTSFGDPTVRIEIEDSGTLPIVLQARLEAVLASHLGVSLPAIETKRVSPKRNRKRRTRLYVPGSVPKFLPNAGLFRPDGIILDLEDSVAPEAKFEARALVRRALWAFDWGESERMVRINDGHLGREDIEATAAAGVEVFLVPKVESPDHLREIDDQLDSLHCDALLIPLIESALGVEMAFEIAKSSPLVVAMSLGLEDYLADIGAQRSEGQEESMWAQGRLVNASRAAGIVPLASVFPGFEDPNAVFEYASSARRRGFEGVGCIHPSQIAPVHRAYASQDEELEKANRIIAAFERAQAEGVGAIQVDGSMVDEPVYRRALAVVKGGGE